MSLNGKWTIPWLGILISTVLMITGCSTNQNQSNSTGQKKLIIAVAAESQYASVIQQIGGPYVSVKAIMSNPNTDPHAFEANTVDAALVGQAQLVVQNGLGYDEFMNKLEAATPNSQRVVIDVGQALGKSPRTLNPHLWYQPATMPRVAQLIEQSLAKIDPAHKVFFQQRQKNFIASLSHWQQLLQQISRKYPDAPVAVTEPVADYMLQAAGLKIMTPWSFQAAVMNGVDPSPQSVQYLQQLLQQHKVKVLIYNLQAVDNTTQMLRQTALNDHVPIVGVYETMTNYDSYQQWMAAETQAILQVLAKGDSRPRP